MASRKIQRENHLHTAGFLPSALLEVSADVLPEASLASSDAGVAGREEADEFEASCHAGILGRLAPMTGAPAEVARGANSALAAILISVSPCCVWDDTVGAPKGEAERPAEEAMAEGDARGLFRATSNVRRDLSSAWSS